MLLFPYQVDVPMTRWPIGNFALIGVICLISLAALSDGMSTDAIDGLVLDGWIPTGMVGHMFLHADFLHLLGNMIFLWVFGNAVCAKLGNLWYPITFLGLGLVAAACHNIVDGVPMIGASGAINAIVGMYLIWFPLNNVTCFYLIVVKPGTFSVSSYWMILLWVVFDILGFSSGDGEVAYMAHLGGFAAGAILALILTRMDMIEFESYEQTLLDCMGFTPTVKTGEELGDELLPAAASSQRPAPVPAPTRQATQGLPAKIRFSCKQCGHQLAVQAEYAGRMGRCPKCSAVLPIPNAGQ